MSRRHLRSVSPAPLDIAAITPRSLPEASLDGLLASITSFSVDERDVLHLHLDDLGPWFAAVPRWSQLHTTAPDDGAPTA